jgi:hypothetical protein
MCREHMLWKTHSFFIKNRIEFGLDYLIFDILFLLNYCGDALFE